MYEFILFDFHTCVLQSQVPAAIEDVSMGAFAMPASEQTVLMEHTYNASLKPLKRRCDVVFTLL